jgi:glycosyltransferase involved in cell wall biosynthesis
MNPGDRAEWSDRPESSPTRRTLLSIVVPVFNERTLLPRALERMLSARLQDGVDREVIVVDDCSVDGTREWLASWAADHPEARIELHPVNRGKGAALRTGFAITRGEFVVVQDADLEYDPREIPLLLEPLLDGRADVVFGTRFLGGTHRVLYFWHAVGNWGLTMLSNMLSNLNLTDMECCYKIFRRDVLARLTLVENRFGFEPEFTAKVARLGCRIYEVPVSYAGRTYAEGKKINWRDGVSAIRCILRYNFFG